MKDLQRTFGSLLIGLALLTRPTLATADCQLLFVGTSGNSSGFARANINAELPRFLFEGATPSRAAVTALPSPRLFWTESSFRRIRSANIDGSDIQTVATVDLFPQGIDVSGDYLYLTERTEFASQTGPGKLLRIRQDGSEVITLVDGIDFAPSLKIGPDGKIYWITAIPGTNSRFVGAVFRANADGTNPTKILDLNALSTSFGEFRGSSLPRDLAIDKTRNKLYIADNISNSGEENRVVWRSNLDGSQAERLGEFPGCFGSICTTCPSCSLTGINTLGLDTTLNTLYLQTERTDGERLLKISLDNVPPDLGGTLLTTSVAGGSPLLPLGIDQGLCNPSGTLSGTSFTDYTVYRPSEGNWYILPNQGAFTSLNQMNKLQWGLPGDIPRLLNANGDNESDLAVWRPREGNWYLCDWHLGVGCLANQVTQFGLANDVPITADFDGDGVDDLTVWRPSSGNWYIRLSTIFVPVVSQWGLPGDVPLTADFNSDDNSDLVVFRPSTGTWYVKTFSVSGNGSTPLSKQWGLPGDVPLLGDYDGDGKPDLAVWRPTNGNWYICPSAANYDCIAQGLTIQFGLPGDVPVVGDFDGDGKKEPAVWRRRTGNWYFRDASGQAIERQWGLPGDSPVTK